MGPKVSTPKPHFSMTHQKFINASFNSGTQQIDTLIPASYSAFQFQYWLKNLEELKKNPHSKSLFLPLTHEVLKSSFDCNINPELKLSFQNFPYLLEEEIKNRTANYQSNHFNQAQLWLLLFSLIKSQKAFSNFSLKVGDIHPHSVFLNSQGIPRLSCQFSWPNQKTNFEKMFYDKTPCFLAPEELDLIRKGQTLDTCYSNTSEAFSIGMTVLSAGLLQSLERYCDMRTFKFNNQYFEYCMNKWMTLKYKNKETNEMVEYSDELKDIVKNLCNLSKHERFLCSKVYDFLESYEDKIRNSERFWLKGYRQARKSLSPTINFPREKQKLSETYHHGLFQKYAGLGTAVSVDARKQVIKEQKNLIDFRPMRQEEHLNPSNQFEHLKRFNGYGGLRAGEKMVEVEKGLKQQRQLQSEKKSKVVFTLEAIKRENTGSKLLSFEDSRPHQLMKLETVKTEMVEMNKEGLKNQQPQKNDQAHQAHKDMIREGVEIETNENINLAESDLIVINRTVLPAVNLKPTSKIQNINMTTMQRATTGNQEITIKNETFHIRNSHAHRVVEHNNDLLAKMEQQLQQSYSTYQQFSNK